MNRDEARAAIRTAVTAEMTHRGWNIGNLAQVAEIDPNTVGDFLNGSRWPQIKTLGRVERALEWPGGTVAAMLAGGPAPSVGGGGDDADDPEELLYRRPEGISDQEWERVKSESRRFIEWQIEQAARER